MHSWPWHMTHDWHSKQLLWLLCCIQADYNLTGSQNTVQCCALICFMVFHRHSDGVQPSTFTTLLRCVICGDGGAVHQTGTGSQDTYIDTYKHANTHLLNFYYYHYNTDHLINVNVLYMYIYSRIYIYMYFMPNDICNSVNHHY